MNKTILVVVFLGCISGSIVWDVLHHQMKETTTKVVTTGTLPLGSSVAVINVPELEIVVERGGDFGRTK